MKIPIRGSVFIEVEMRGNWLDLEGEDRAFMSKCVDRFRDIYAEALNREAMQITGADLEAKLGIVQRTGGLIR